MPLFDQTSNDSNPEKLFEAIGTFFENIPEEAKQQLQKFFEALARLSNGVFYNLYQSDLIQYLEYSEGWLELLYKKYRVNFDNTGDEDFKNTTNEYLDSPKNVSLSGGGTGTEVYAYRVAAYNAEGETIASEEISISGKSSDLASTNLTISWDPVPNATGYKVYGRSIRDHRLIQTTASTTYNDNASVEDANEEPKDINTALYSYLYTLPENRIYLSIPQLIEGDSTTLTEGTDYELVSTDKIRFINSSLTKKTDTVKETTYNEYLAKTGIILSPVLSDFYLKAFGKDNPKEILLDGKYLPHLQGYSGLSDFDKAQARAEHLKYFCWASSVYLRKKPTIDSIERSYGLAQDYPFAYEAGTVTAVTNEFITVSGQSVFTYDIGSGNTHLFTSGESVDQFDLLVSGISLKDYYSHPLVISGLATATEEPRLVIELTSAATGFSPDDDIISKFKRVSIPAGLVLKT